jgi:mannosyl-3-phosphoglycerate phosphatase
LTTPFVVFTDLDACLLDEETHRPDEARPALEALARAEAPLVLCTSKTRAEVEAVRRDLGLGGPFVFENGGGIAIPPATRGWRPPLRPRGEGPLLIRRGTPHAALVLALREIAAETGLCLRGFSEIPAQEAAEMTGLEPEDACRAAAREFDEPFLIVGGGTKGLRPDEAERRVVAAAARRGLRTSRGGRFLHLTGPVDKGGAVRQLLALHAGPAVSVALGDAENDLTMLQAVDRPVLVPRRDGLVDVRLARALPRAARAPWPGPRGWNEAVLAVLADSGG